MFSIFESLKFDRDRIDSVVDGLVDSPVDSPVDILVDSPVDSPVDSFADSLNIADSGIEGFIAVCLARPGPWRGLQPLRSFGCLPGPPETPVPRAL